MKVRIVPHIDDLKGGESGIHEIVRKWFKHLPKFGIDLVDKNADNFDILAVHAGMGSRYPEDLCVVSHLHGLYWTSDYPALHWEWAANDTVINSMRRADGITVPHPGLPKACSGICASTRPSFPMVSITMSGSTIIPTMATFLHTQRTV